MAQEGLPSENILEDEPQEYRIILRRNARDEDISVEDLPAFIASEPEDAVSSEDMFWEDTVTDLKTANLWELAGLVPTIEPDLYELQLKVGENEYQFVALFGSEEDYEEVIDDITTAQPELLGDDAL